MRLIILLLLLHTPLSVCRDRMRRCELRCAEDHEVGSMDHLHCKERCWEDYLVCKKERDE